MTLSCSELLYRGSSSGCDSWKNRNGWKASGEGERVKNSLEHIDIGSSLLDNFTNRNYVLLSTHFTPFDVLSWLY